MVQLTLVGAVTLDRVPHADTWVAGGAVLYAGAAAAALGVGVRVLTAHDAGFERPSWTRDWTWVSESRRTTAFENVDLGDRRTQRLWARCGSLPASQLARPADSSECWLVLAPVFDEVPLGAWLDWAEKAPNLRLSILPQGLLRRTTSRKYPSPVAARPALLALARGVLERGLKLSCVSLSDSELAGEPESLEPLRACAEVLVVTRGACGASAYSGEHVVQIDPAPVMPRDVTGAGDGFAGGLIAALASALPLADALRFASASAGLTTEHRGACEIDARRAIELARGIEVRMG